MNSRRKGREFCLQLLYAMEVGKIGFGESIEGMAKEAGVTEEAKAYGLRLAEKVMAKQSEIDEKINLVSNNWDMERLAVIDKIIIRCSAAEMMYFNDIPVRVSINEAVDIAKKFSTGNSSRFVNGILDSIAREISNIDQRKEDNA